MARGKSIKASVAKGGTRRKPHSRNLPILLLDWYDRHRRILPWRALPGEKPDPYRIWLSEIMLQQTTVAAVGPYFMKFMRRWPTVKALAKADLEEVMAMWAGLGYYSRAQRLHACANVVCDQYKGKFPQEESELLGLSGLGPYTVAALLAIAFDKRANVVDGNVERVVARLFHEQAPLPKSKPILRAHAAELLPDNRFGDYAQALMDLGATICTPRSPKCSQCPWNASCESKKKGDAENLPRRTKGKEKPLRRALAFVILNKEGAVWLRRRPLKGLLAHMMEVPSSDWAARDFPPLREALSQAGLPSGLKGTELEGRVLHTFTHFDLEIKVVWVKAGDKLKSGRWVSPDALDAQALPSVMRKIIRHAFAKKNR